jgi:hypothetical protein
MAGMMAAAERSPAADLVLQRTGDQAA